MGVEQIDQDGDGEIDLDEFMVMMKRKERRVNRGPAGSASYDAELKEAFKVFDKNNDGSITKEELAETMKALGEDLSVDDIKFMMDEVDINNDGTIDFQEFK